MRFFNKTVSKITPTPASAFVKKSRAINVLKVYRNHIFEMKFNVVKVDQVNRSRIEIVTMRFYFFLFFNSYSIISEMDTENDIIPVVPLTVVDVSRP